MAQEPADPYIKSLYDDSLAEKALQRISKLGQAGGIKQDQIIQTHLAAAIYSVDAVSVIEFEQQAEPVKRSLKKEIRVIEVGDFSAAENLTAQKIKDSSTNTAFVEALHKQLGGAEGYILARNIEGIVIPALSDHYSITQKCESCGGSCRLICPNCGGRKQDVCGECGGRKQVICVECNGSGQTSPDQNGHRQSCSYCQGRQYLPCRPCNGSGITFCGQCAGQGQIACGACGSKGAVTRIAFIKVTAGKTDILNQAQMPENLKSCLFKIGLGKLLQGGHIQITKAKNPFSEADEGENNGAVSDRDPYAYHFPPQKGEGQIQLFYRLQIPYAELSVTLADQEITTKLLGKKGVIAEMPPFLNEIVSRETARLQKKHNAGEITKDNIESHLSLPLIKDGWNMLDQMGRKKALTIFARKYGSALDNPRINALFHILLHIKKKTTPSKTILFVVIALALLAAITYILYLQI